MVFDSVIQPEAFASGGDFDTAKLPPPNNNLLKLVYYVGCPSRNDMNKAVLEPLTNTGHNKVIITIQLPILA